MSRSMRWKRNLMLAAPISLVGIWACFNSPVETPSPKVTQETQVKVEQNIKNQVDLLFVVDDSPSMTPKQTELKARFPELIKILDDFGKGNPAWYHIGVITTDVGAASFNLGSGQCKPGGRGGKLQAIGAAADPSCVAPTGLNFIDYNQLMKDANGVPASNLPAGQDLAKTFQCMASVGDKGCGFEQHLEAAYQALHTKPAENHDFLRPNALLVVVFVTDEDDCSVDAMNGQDLFDPSKTAQYGALLSYRCTQYGIQCRNPATGNMEQLPYGDSGAAKWTDCTSLAAPNGKLADINKYINLFKATSGNGGLKVDPNDVILVGIDASASEGVSTLLANPSPPTPGPYTQCPGPISTTCGVVLQHSCISPDNPAFFGDPAVRLNQVIGSVKNQQLTSICDTSYQSALEKLGKLIVSNIGAGCITSPFELDSSAGGSVLKPDCVVEDITSNGNGTTTVTEIPWCGNNHEVQPTCWLLEAKTVCDPDPTKKAPNCCEPVCAKDGEPAQHYGVKIDRGGKMIPASTNARVACSTVAVSKNPQTGNLPVCGPAL